jgi:hypothetical protein
VHFAVAPMVAAMRLTPGQHVGADGTTSDPIGIVDPFLRIAVDPGERFWMVLYPNTITSLRHEWVHPAMDECEAERQTARDSLAEFASREGLSFDELMSGLNYAHEHNDSVVCFPSDINYSIQESEAPDVWRAYCLYTGKKMPIHEIIEATTFRCAC